MNTPESPSRRRPHGSGDRNTMPGHGIDDVKVFSAGETQTAAPPPPAPDDPASGTDLSKRRRPGIGPPDGRPNARLGTPDSGETAGEG